MPPPDPAVPTLGTLAPYGRRGSFIVARDRHKLLRVCFGESQVFAVHHVGIPPVPGHDLVTTTVLDFTQKTQIMQTCLALDIPIKLLGTEDP